MKLPVLRAIRLPRTRGLLLMILGVVLYAAMVLGAAGDTTADRVLGQTGFTTSAINLMNGQGLNFPAAVAIDTSIMPNRLYVADEDNSRVLGWRDAASFANGAAADLVIGQSDFNSYSLCNGNENDVSASCVGSPMAVAVDGSGNLYVADYYNSRVLAYTNPFAACAGLFPCVGGPANVILGQGGSFTASGCNNGGPSANSLCLPFGLAVDGAGHLYVADQFNHRVLEYNSPLTDATADTVLGQGGSFTSNACNNGGVSANSLCYPAAVAVDEAGHLYVADDQNSRVLEYNTPLTNATADTVLGQGGSFTSSACDFDTGGSGPTAIDLCFPVGVTADAAGHLYVTDNENSRVLEYNTPLTNATADTVFGQGGSFTTFECDNGGVSADNLCYPVGVAVDAAGNLYVADNYNSRVLEYNTPLTTDTTADRVLGQLGFMTNAVNMPTLNGQGLNFPAAVAIDTSVMPNRLYVADDDNSRVLGWRDAASFASGAQADLLIGQPDFTSSFCLGVVGLVDANTLCDPSGLAVDGSGNLYVADSGNNRVLEYTNPFAACGGVFPCVGGPANVVLGQGGSFFSNECDNGGVSANSLCLEFGGGVAVDGVGHLYVADDENSRVLEYNTPLTNATADTVFGQGGSFTSTKCNNGGRSANSLCVPTAAAVDAAGHLYVADSNNSRVLEYNTPLTNTTADTVFGQGGSFTSNECNSSADSLCFPTVAALDVAGDLYIVDNGNNRVLEYKTPLTNTTADTVFGQGGSFTSNVCNSGGLSANSLCNPVAVAGDAAGNLYVADGGNNRVLEYDQPVSTPTPTATPTPVPVTLKITPKALKFSKTTVGTPSKPKTVKVSNPKGNKKHQGLPVLIEMISDPPVFTETNTCLASLASGSSCTIAVTFTPSIAGQQTGTLTITDNASGTTQKVPLSGEGK